MRGRIGGMHIPAKVDYGMRALLALTARGEPTTAEALALTHAPIADCARYDRLRGDRAAA